ncbi:hypothetical protein Emed_007568 [Eimeria media]
MENLGAGQRPLPEQEEAGELPEGPSVASHHKDTAASALDSEDPSVEEATRATRSVTNRRVLLGALATVVLALVLATALRERLPSVATPPPVHAPEEPGKGLPVVEEEPKKPPTVHAPEEPEKGLPVVEEEPKTPSTVHAPEPEKGLPVAEEDPKTPPPVHAPEEGGKELAVVKEEPGVS